MQNLCRRFLIASLGLLLIASPAYAKKAAPARAPAAAPTKNAAPQTQSMNPDDPIDISAEESLEWYKDKGLYVARGKARAVTKGTTVEADLLTARQRQGTTKTEGKDIDRLTAEGNVRITDAKQQAIGQMAVYDVDRKTFHMTGDNLRYVTEKNVVTAKESFEFFENENVAVARGRAVAEHDQSRIEADAISAHFSRNPAGQMQMEKMNAKGDVIIVTKDGGVVRGARAVYDVKRDVATVLDDVRITRGETQLAGGKAEVDFKSGQSRLLSGGAGRVRVLLPSSGAKTGKGKP